MRTMQNNEEINFTQMLRNIKAILKFRIIRSNLTTLPFLIANLVSPNLKPA